MEDNPRRGRHKKKETELWEAFLGGDREAFAELFRYCYRSLYAYAVSCGMDTQLADDAVQEIFTKLYVSPSLVRDAATLRSFLFRSVKNTSVDRHRKKGKYVDIEDIYTSFPFTYSIDDTITDKEQGEIIRKKVESLLESLSARQKEVVYLRFLYGMDYDEISSVMNITNQTARNMLHRAMEKLRSSGSGELLMLLSIILAGR